MYGLNHFTFNTIEHLTTQIFVTKIKFCFISNYIKKLLCNSYILSSFLSTTLRPFRFSNKSNFYRRLPLFHDFIFVEKKTDRFYLTLLTNMYLNHVSTRQSSSTGLACYKLQPRVCLIEMLSRQVL